MSGAPLVAISALTGEGIQKLMPAVIDARVVHLGGVGLMDAMDRGRNAELARRAPAGPIAIYDKGIVKEQEYDSFGQFQLLAREGDLTIPRVKPAEPLKVQNQAFLDCIKAGRITFSDGPFSAGVVKALDAGGMLATVERPIGPDDTSDDVERDLAALGFTVTASRGTASFLRSHGLDVEVIHKVNEGRPNVADQIVNRKIDLVINTPLGRESFFDDKAVRRAAMMNGVPCITTLAVARASIEAIANARAESAVSLQERHEARAS